MVSPSPRQWVHINSPLITAMITSKHTTTLLWDTILAYLLQNRNTKSKCWIKKGKATHVMQTPNLYLSLKLFKTTQPSTSVCCLTQHQDDWILSWNSRTNDQLKTDFHDLQSKRTSVIFLEHVVTAVVFLYIFDTKHVLLAQIRNYPVPIAPKTVELRSLSSRANGKFPRRNWWGSRPEINVQSGTWSRSPAILGKTSSTPRGQKPPNYFGKPIR